MLEVVVKLSKLDIKRRLTKLKRSAKKRNIKVEVNEAFYKKLLEMGCIYCGRDLSFEKGYCIDRHDNSKGYIMSNLSPCCKRCNRAKGTMSHWEFIAWLEDAYLFTRMCEKEFGNVYNEKATVKTNNIMKNKSWYKNSNTIEMDGER